MRQEVEKIPYANTNTAKFVVDLGGGVRGVLAVGAKRYQGLPGNYVEPFAGLTSEAITAAKRKLDRPDALEPLLLVRDVGQKPPSLLTGDDPPETTLAQVGALVRDLERDVLPTWKDSGLETLTARLEEDDRGNDVRRRFNAEHDLLLAYVVLGRHAPLLEMVKRILARIAPTAPGHPYFEKLRSIAEGSSGSAT